MYNYDKTELLFRIKQNADRVEAALDGYCADEDEDYGVIFRAERYSLLGGGKRIRPFIVNEVCRALGGDESASMPLACAIEMIHTYSLIHDDLPCMDDDDMRRGKPSNHIEFGYANALLAGDALLTRAFATVAQADTLGASRVAEAVKILALAAGDNGMIGGQVIDLESEGKKIELSKLYKLHSLKTGALILCSARLGCLAAGIDLESERAKNICEYAAAIGLVFQIIDDVLDVTADESQLGKSVGSDAENEKTTFLSFYTVEQAKELATEVTESAVGLLDGIDGCDTLRALAYYLLERTN